MTTYELNRLALASCKDRMGHVHEMSDVELRLGHALLDDLCNSEFAVLIDQGLDRLEAQFNGFVTRRSIRASLGR